ncbi:MAG: hypothetical protein LBU89_11885 [Fibromonadaceae bacterium]|jgi:hypothetical protein|nr:hypothetical protein [Fibromonadaceae bacterium]
MEVALSVLNEENLRTLVILVAIVVGFIWQNSQFDKKMDKRFNEYDQKMDKRFDSFYQQLKYNDFAHLNSAIEALTYVLKKNNLIDSDDAKFVESKLDK